MTSQTFNFTVVSACVLVVMLSFISDRHVVQGRPSQLDVSQKNQNRKIEDDFLVPAAISAEDQETPPLNVENENDYFVLPAANFQILDENEDDYNSFNDSYFLFNHEPDISSENSKPVTGSDETNIQDILYVLRKLNQNSSLPKSPIRNIETKNVLTSNNNRSGNGSGSENKYGDGDNSTSLSSGIDMDSSNIFWTNVTILCLLIFVALCLRCYVVERAQRRVEVMVNILEQQIRHSESASASASSSGVNASLLPATTSDIDDKDPDSTAFTLNPDDEDDDQEELPSYNQAMGINTF